MADPPGAPEGPEVSEICKDYAILTWHPPASDGGSPITGYSIERRLTSSSRWVKITKELVTELTLKVGDLIEDNEYEFRVVAENKVGAGPPSSATNPVKAKDPWGRYMVLNKKKKTGPGKHF